jgi:alpha-D-ribose 1-methylphosphonate 5-triphosphate synthase subunit PhnG
MKAPSETPDAEQARRRAWMAVLARAGADELENLVEAAGRPVYSTPRPAETGLCMVRGRMGGSGRPFNLGEMTLTRCVIQLEDNTTGVAYVTGRDRRQAELAALADALLQSGRMAPADLAELERRQSLRLAERSAQVAATRVDFFTLVRGED